MPTPFEVYLDRARPLNERLLRAGWTPAGAAAVLGNFHQESGFDPSAFNVKEGAIGLPQWRGPRRAGLEAFAAKAGLDPASIDAQLGYLDYELATDPRYAGLKAKLNVMPPADGAMLFGRVFERPAVVQPVRGEMAAKYHAAFGGIPVPTSTPPINPDGRAPALPPPVTVAEMPVPAGAADIPAPPVESPMARILASMPTNSASATAPPTSATDDTPDLPSIETNDNEVRTLAARVWARLMQKRGLAPRLG